MIAALPMYDRPELRAQTDALWSAIREALRTRGLDAPDTLARDQDPWTIWQSPGLILAQTCGLPFRTRLHDRVQLVATPDYALPGCPPGHYNSVILARTEPLPDAPRVALNEALSQSGWAALHDWASQSRQPLGPRVFTGGHANSVAAVAEGAADLCAIDAQSWRLIQRHDPPDGLQELARTAPTPALPFITAKANDPAPIRAALADAIAALPSGTSDALAIKGIIALPPAAYLSLPIPPAP